MVLKHAKLKVATLILFALVCVGIFLYLFQAAGGRIGFSSQYKLNVIVPQTFNLVPNSDVDAAGAKIGIVDSVKPDGVNAKVEITIQKKTSAFPPIYKNATAQVRIKTLVGESYLALTPGTKSAGAIPSGGTLTVSHAVDAVPLEQVLGMFDPKTRAAVQQNMKGLGVGLNGHGTQLNQVFGDFDPTVTNGQDLMNVLLPERTQVAELIDNTGQVFQAISERTAEYQGLINDAKTTAVAVNTRAQQLQDTFAQLPSTLDQAQETVNRLSKFSVRATPLFSNLRVASHYLSPAIQQLEPTAAAARTLFAKLKPFLARFKPVVTQLKPASQKLQTVILPLDAVLRQADPALAYLQTYSREFGSFFSNDSGFMTPDKLGERGRVFLIIGANDFNNLTPAEQNLLNALEQIGTAGKLGGSKLNSYPQPGTAGNPNSTSNFKNIQASP